MANDVSREYQGKVLDAAEVRAGSELSVDHASGVSVLQVYDSADFDETGGTVAIEEERYVYLAKDDDLNTLTLATPLTMAYQTDVEVLCFPLAVEVEATVSIDDQEDIIVARVPRSLIHAINAEVKDGDTSESVIVRLENDDWVIADIISQDFYSAPDAGDTNLDEELEDLRNDLDNLNNVVLPQLQLDLAAANEELDELYNVTIPGLNTELDTAQNDLNAAQLNISTLNGKFPVSGTNIQDGAITTPKMTANTINGDRITTNSMDAGRIVAGSITTDRMTANNINGDRIIANTLSALKIVAGSITTDRMTANTINGDRIATNTLHADKIVANSISTNKLAVNFLFGYTITGAIIQTGTSGPRVVMYQDVNDDGQAAGVIRFPYGYSGENAGTAGGIGAISSNTPRVQLSSGPYSGRPVSSTVRLEPGASMGIVRIGGQFVASDGVILGSARNSVNSPGIWATDGTQSTTVWVTSGGIVGRNTSVRASKLMIKDLAHEESRKLLSIQPRTWYDRSSYENYADYLDGKEGASLDYVYEHRRIPGVIAEELLEAGADQFVTYDADGNLSGVMYDRIAVALIPLLRELTERVEQLENA